MKTTIYADAVIDGIGHPEDLGIILAQHTVDYLKSDDDVAIDLRLVSGHLVISSFFYGFLNRIRDNNFDLLQKSKNIRWIARFDFQENHISKWVDDFFLSFPE